MGWRPKPASWPWLAAHEARLLWRTSGGARFLVLLVAGGFLLLLLHAGAWFVMRGFDLEWVLGKASKVVILGTFLFLFITLSAAFGLAVNALFQHGDQELVLSSPVPIRDVYAVRGIMVALGAVALPALFWSPLANMGAVHGRWGALAAYPVWAAVGLLCSALAFAGTLGLARLLGPRRAFRAAQVLGAVIGAGIVIAMQFQSVLPEGTRERIQAWTKSDAGVHWLGPQSLLTWPVRALFGDPLPALAMIALGVGAFVLVVRATAGAFANATREQPGVTLRPLRATRHAQRRFRSGLSAVVIAKELKLIARDPTLIAKSLVQLLYFVPLMMILVRKSQVAGVLAASLVLLASTLAGTFAWIAVSGEEAPDLLNSAPVDSERLRWLKVAAALAPVVVVALPFLAWYAYLSLRMLAWLVVFLGAGLASSGVIQVWTGIPGSGRDVRMRFKKNMLANFVEGMSRPGWAGACYVAIVGYYPALPAGVVLGLVGPVTAWFIGRARAAS